MNPITLSEMSDEDEEVKIISSYEPQDDEIAIVFDSSKITGGNALDFFQFTRAWFGFVGVHQFAVNTLQGLVVSTVQDAHVSCTCFLVFLFTFC